MLTELESYMTTLLTIVLPKNRKHVPFIPFVIFSFYEALVVLSVLCAFICNFFLYNLFRQALYVLYINMSVNQPR